MKLIRLDIMQKMEEEIKKQKAEEQQNKVHFEKRQQNKIDSQRRKLLAVQRIKNNGPGIQNSPGIQNIEFYKPTHVTHIFKPIEIKQSHRANNSGTKSVGVEKIDTQQQPKSPKSKEEIKRKLLEETERLRKEIEEAELIQKSAKTKRKN